VTPTVNILRDQEAEVTPSLEDNSGAKILETSCSMEPSQLNWKYILRTVLVLLAAVLSVPTIQRRQQGPTVTQAIYWFLAPGRKIGPVSCNNVHPSISLGISILVAVMASDPVFELCMNHVL
jgi:hypothetical protein